MTTMVNEVDPYIANQIKSRARPAVVKIQFLNFRSKYPQGTVIAVEGNDDKVVYSYWISRVNPNLSYEFFVCGGKNGVRSLRNSLFQDLANAEQNVIFLVDRDFDDLDGFLSNDNVFILDRYSFENYLVERCVIDETIKVIFPGSGDPINRLAVCDLFESVYLDFLEASKDLNRKIFLARKLGLDIGDKVPDSLSFIGSISVDKVDQTSIKSYDLINFDSCYPTDVINDILEDFKKLDPATRYRGKYIHKFLIGWLEELIKEFKNPKAGIFSVSYNGQDKIKFNEIGLGPLAQRAPLPSGFEHFFNNY